MGYFQFDHGTGDLVEGSKWSEYLNLLYQVLGITEEDEIEPFIIYQYSDGGVLYESFQKRFETSGPINTDYKMQNFAERVGRPNPIFWKNFIRTKGMVERPENGGKWKKAIVVKYDRHRKVFLLEKAAEAKRGVVKEYANLVDFRIRTLRQQEGLDYSSSQVFALIAEGTGKPINKLNTNDFPLVYFIEEDIDGKKKVRFEQGAIRETVNSLDHLVWFVDKTDHYDTQEFFDRLVWWANNDLNMGIKSHKEYPFKTRPFNVVFDKTPEENPEIRYSLVVQPPTAPTQTPSTENPNAGQPEGATGRALIDDGSANEEVIPISEVLGGKYTTPQHLPKLNAARQKFLKENPGTLISELRVRVKKYLEKNGVVTEEHEFTFAAGSADTKAGEDKKKKGKSGRFQRFR